MSERTRAELEASIEKAVLALQPPEEVSEPERLGCPYCGEPVFTDLRLTRVPVPTLNALNFEYSRAATFNVGKVYCAAGHKWASFDELVESIPEPEPERPWP